MLRAPAARRAALALLAILILGAAALTTSALGYWTGSDNHGTGDGVAGAATVSEGSAPTVSETGSTNVVVTWGNSSVSNGAGIDGYVVTRYDQATGVEASTIGAGCAGTRTATTCTEASTPAGNWEYTVTPVLGTNWRGSESPRSGAINTGPGTMTLDHTLFGGTVAPLPDTVSGTLSGFGSSETLTYMLDGVELATASPAQSESDGTAIISLTIPATTSDGPHTITVVGAGAEASVGIIVDTTPPTIDTFLTPAANAAGWNNSTTEVNGTVDDLDGSGVAFAKYTDDGSDPKTSPTAQFALGPVSVSVTTTLRFYLADLAGNESAVLTQQVNIDTLVPYFSVESVNIVGGAYTGPPNPVTGEPGNAYYRGADAGSLQFLVSPYPMGGSPIVGAYFSALQPASSVGFTFDSSAITTPAGGPYLSGVFSWVAGTTSTPAGTISVVDAAGNTLGGAGAMNNDSTPPSGGSVDAVGLVGTGGRYSTSLELNLNLAPGTDAASGLADGGVANDVPATLERASAALDSSNGITDGTCGVYSAYTPVEGDDPAATLSHTVPTDSMCYRFRYLVADHVGNIATYTSPDIKVLSGVAQVPPSDATLTSVSGITAQSVSGTTVYYNPALSGSFEVATSASATYSGVERVTFPGIAGFTGGGAVTTPRTGTTFVSTYNWAANAATASPGVQPISVTNNVGQTATNNAAFSVVKDGSAPSGGSVTFLGLGGAPAGYSQSTTLSVAFSPGTDSGAGLASTGANLSRASASLTSNGTSTGVCGTFGSYSSVAANPTSPASNTVPADRTCYRYRYQISDKVGNVATYVSSDIKVNSTAPSAPTLAFSALSNTYYSGTGTALYYRPAASSGGFTVTAQSTDTTAGISGYGFPAFPAGWTGTSGGANVRTYSWAAASPTAPGSRTVTATNYAGLQSSSSFTVASDGAPPSGGSVTYTNGATGASTVSVSFSAGTDAGSGLAASSGSIQTATATLTNGNCGTFTSFTTSATNPTSPVPLPIANSTCYQYRYLISDNLGNQAIYTSASVVKADTTAPTNTITLSNVTSGAYKSASTVYYRGVVAGSFTLTNAVSDGGSAPASSTTATLAGTSFGWTHTPSTVTTPAGGPYVSNTFSWVEFTSTAPTETVTGSDAAGNSVPATLTYTNDSTSPGGGSVDATGLSGTGGRYATSTTLNIALNAGTDAGSGIDPVGSQLLRASAQLADGSCGTYGAYTQVGANDPSSPVTNTVPGDHTCYRYRYNIADRVGNTRSYTSPDIKVDTDSAHLDFLQPVTSPETAEPGPAMFDTGDIDNDGDIDIVSSSLLTAYYSVLTNDGVGSFRETPHLANGTSVDIGLGKFDNDSHLDIALLYNQTPPSPGFVVIFKGLGNGTFGHTGAANTVVSTGVRPTSLTVGNFNGDTIDDVAVVNQQHDANTTAGTVMTFLGNTAGTGAFTSTTPAQTLTTQLGATDVAFADFNGGSKDLVVTNHVSASVSLLSGDGTGFAAPVHTSAGAPVYFLAAESLNAGSTMDLVATVAGSNPSQVRTLFGDGVGGFAMQASTVVGTGHSPAGLVASDFDNDGDADIAVTNSAEMTVSTLANDGSGAFTISAASPEVGLGAAGSLLWGIVSADFDGSGYKDLATSTVFTDPGEIRPLLNQNGPRANLSVALSHAPASTPQGQDITYTVTVTNAGPSTPTSVKVTDDLPDGVTFDAAASSPSCSAAGPYTVTVSCDYGAVAPGSPESLQIVVTTSATTPSSVVNTATVAGNRADATPADNTSTTTASVLDSTGPTGGSVDAAGLVGTGGRYSTSTTLSIVLAKGTDPAGLAATGAQLKRATATLTSTAGANGSCGTYGTAVQIGADDPVSPVADIVPAGQACYRYEYVVTDTLGNATTYTSPGIKVDTTAPSAPAFSFSALTNTHWTGGASTTVYYRPTATSGSFTATATAADTNSGIASYTMPSLGAGWTTPSGATGVQTYAWTTAGPTAPVGPQNATAANNATLTSAAGFTLVSDTTAPATGSVTYTDGYRATTSVAVSFARGTDAGAGVNAASGVLQRAGVALTAGTCASFTGATFTAVGGTNPASPFTDTTVTTGNCYMYRYLVSDNVGNQATYTSASVAKIDTTAPVIARSTATKTTAAANQISSNTAYFVYAQVTDTTGAISTVTANTTSFDAGVTAAPLTTTGGPWTIAGVSYNRRGATGLVADNFLAWGWSYNYTITATDAAGHVVGPATYWTTAV